MNIKYIFQSESHTEVEGEEAEVSMIYLYQYVVGTFVGRRQFNNSLEDNSPLNVNISFLFAMFYAAISHDVLFL